MAHVKKEKKRVAVIGAGMGGMCTAARLARAGCEVTVYEASDRHGGKCRTEWIDGFAFDTGPSLLTLPAVYRDFFQRTGDVMGRVLELEPVNPSFDYRFADGSNITFANLSRKETLASIEKVLGSEASSQWDSLMRTAEAMWDVSREPFIESELKSPISLLKRSTFLKDLFVIAPWKSMRDLNLANAKLRMILDRYATYSGSDPRVAPAVLASIAFVEEAFGAWHIKGGVGRLADAVYQRCLDRGVTFEFENRITEITHDTKKVTGIHDESGRHIHFDTVVANADAGLVYNSLIKGRIPKLRSTRTAIRKAGPSLAGFSLLLGLKADPSVPQLSHHTILFPENYDAEFDAIFSQKKPVINPTIYICAPRDPTMVTRPGDEAWFVLVNAPRHDQHGIDGFDWSDHEFNQKYAQSLIDQIEARGISVRSRLELLEIRTPADLERTVLAPGGSIYGTSSNGARSAFLRAKNRSPLAGLFCVGGSAHPGGGLPLVGLSAEMVTLAVLDKKEVH
jgi:phytoene desaturase